MPNPLISTLVDNFDAGIDAETYDVGTWGDGTLITAAHTVVADSGRVAVVPPASGSGGGNGLITTGIYDATNQSVVMLMQPGLTAQGQNCMVNLGTGPNQFYGIWAIPGANSLIVRLRNGFNANVYSGTYSYSDKIWVKIQHRSSDNRWLFYVADFAAASDPPEDAEFTLLASRGADFGPGAVKLNFGVFGVVQQFKATQYFDGLNTATTAAGTPVGLATESDIAVARSPVAARSAGVASSAETAIALAPVQRSGVGLASEAEVALALAGGVAGTVGLAGEVEIALALVPVQRGAVGTAVANDNAIALAPVQILDVGPAQESDSALAAAAVQRRAVGIAAANDNALALAPVQAMPVQTAAESDQALRLLIGGGPVAQAPRSRTAVFDRGPRTASVARGRRVQLVDRARRIA